jgi:hypothetical protein
VALCSAAVGGKQAYEAVGGELLGDVDGPAGEPGSDESGDERGVSKPMRW